MATLEHFRGVWTPSPPPLGESGHLAPPLGESGHLAPTLGESGHLAPTLGESGHLAPTLEIHMMLFDYFCLSDRLFNP